MANNLEPALQSAPLPSLLLYFASHLPVKLDILSKRILRQHGRAIESSPIHQVGCGRFQYALAWLCISTGFATITATG